MVSDDGSGHVLKMDWVLGKAVAEDVRSVTRILDVVVEGWFAVPEKSEARDVVFVHKAQVLDDK